MEKCDYYVALDNDVYGPYSLRELCGLGLLPDTLIATSDSEWLMASEYPELRHLFDDNRLQLIERQEEPECWNQRLIYRQKRKAAFIGVITFGLAGLAVVGIGETWRSNLFAGTSLDHGGLGFVMKVISFMLLSIVVAIPFFIISLIQLIYYSLKLSIAN